MKYVDIITRSLAISAIGIIGVLAILIVAGSFIWMLFFSIAYLDTKFDISNRVYNPIEYAICLNAKNEFEKIRFCKGKTKLVLPNTLPYNEIVRLHGDSNDNKIQRQE